ncbi:MAG: thioesterase superfamily protein [Bacteroidetes bacterium]|jgi:acyl-CoA hydrolase|nr:thioesterase superfamily protein [Bacteroidota bacterium]
MQNQITFQFISEPSDVNYGGNVHGGAVMKWIDQTAYACATSWAEGYAVTLYVGGIRFYKPIHIGDLVKVVARVIYTGKTSIHIACDVHSRKLTEHKYEKTTHCVIVFVALDENRKPRASKKWEAHTDHEIALEKYAIRLMELRKGIEEEMRPFLADYFE